MHDLARVAILTEAGPETGHGHLGRCVALCEAFESLGCSCDLIVAGDAPQHMVGNRQVRVGDWREADSAVRSCSGADIVVIDSYNADRSVYAAVAAAVPLSVYVDDFARIAYPAGIVVNGSPAAIDLFRGTVPQRTVLAGPTFQPLRSAFWHQAPRTVRPTIEKVMVASGGTDAGGMRGRLASALRDVLADVRLDVVDAPRSAAAMAAAMGDADVAVAAAGQMLYELAATGTPAVVIGVAENQFSQARAFEQAGAVRYGGAWSEPGVEQRVVRLLLELQTATTRAAMAEAGQRLVDGSGGLRVARTAVCELLDRAVALRPAVPEDEAALLELANDPVVRAASFSDALIAAEEHHRWLTALLADADADLLIAEHRGRTLGQVRFQISGDHAVVSISLASMYRGIGYGSHLLERATRLFLAERSQVTELLARVRSENVASLRLFQAAGYSASDPTAVLPDGALELRKSIG